jgi:hypothetical protein
LEGLLACLPPSLNPERAREGGMRIRQQENRSEQEITEALTQAGCEEARLRVFIELLRRAPTRDSMKSLCGFRDGRQMESSVASVRWAAAVIRVWTGSLVGRHILLSDTHMSLSAETRVPEFLESFADKMERLVPEYSRHRRYPTNLARAWLTSYVKAKTNAWRDRDVADLLCVTLRTHTKSEDQKQWRHDNQDLLLAENSRILWALTLHGSG